MNSQASAANNLFLIGPMGAGKSSIGRHLASILGKAFYDSDQEIEAASGAAVALIFELEGEEGFRARETRMLARLTALENIVLATGGGAVLPAENRAYLQARGRIIYIRATAETILLRTMKDKKRPLLQGTDRARKLRQLLKARTPLYESLAMLTFDSDKGSAQQTANEIARTFSGACAEAFAKTMQ